MEKQKVKNLEDFLEKVFYTFREGDSLIVSGSVREDISGSIETRDKYSFGPMHVTVEKQILYRGHSIKEWQLIPAIGRKTVTKIKEPHQIESQEAEMIQQFERRRSLINSSLHSPLDILIYAQHFGMATRLLDWTTNPLVALFFACSENLDKDGAVHMIFHDLQATEMPKDPLRHESVVVFPPALNNNRIVAQNGWFTIHPFSMKESQITRDSVIFEIPRESKEYFLKRLDILGINFESIFPGVEGTCKYLNWKILSV